jgi:hypothetical protein
MDANTLCRDLGYTPTPQRTDTYAEFLRAQDAAIVKAFGLEALGLAQRTVYATPLRPKTWSR